MEKDIKFIVRKTISGSVLPPDLAWKKHYDPIGQNIIKLRKCYRALKKKRLKKCRKAGKKAEKEGRKISKNIFPTEDRRLQALQAIGQLPQLPEYPENFPANGKVVIKARKYRNKIKMRGILSKTAVKKQRQLFIKRILAQTGFTVDHLDFENFELNCLADVAHDFLKKFVDAMQFYNKGFYPIKVDPLHLVETTLQNTGFAGISGLQKFYNNQIIKKHDVLHRKCGKLIGIYKEFLPQQENEGSTDNVQALPVVNIFGSDPPVVNPVKRFDQPVRNQNLVFNNETALPIEAYEEVRDIVPALPALSIFGSEPRVRNQNLLFNNETILPIESYEEVRDYLRTHDFFGNPVDMNLYAAFNCNETVDPEPDYEKIRVFQLKRQEQIRINELKRQEQIRISPVPIEYDQHIAQAPLSVCQQTEEHLQDSDSVEFITEIINYPSPPEVEIYSKVPSPNTSPSASPSTSQSVLPSISSIILPSKSSTKSPSKSSWKSSKKSPNRRVRFSATTEERYLCDYCERNYASVASLICHIENIHKISPPKKKRRT